MDFWISCASLTHNTFMQFDKNVKSGNAKLQRKMLLILCNRRIVLHVFLCMYRNGLP